MSFKGFFSARILNSLIFCTLAIGVFVTYSGVYHNQFLLDDEFLIIKNQFIRSWGYIFEIFSSNSTAGAGGTDSFYRPMQTLMYLIFNKTFGYGPPTFHFLNILLHFLNSLFIFGIGLRLGISKLPILIATLIWALHPLHSEAIAYMSATADPLHSFFCLWAIYLFSGSIQVRTIMLGSLAFVFALMSKESAIVLPALVLLILLYKKDFKICWSDFRLSLPFWAIAIGYLLLRKTWLNFDDTFHFYKEANIYTENISVRVFTFLATVPEYLKLIVWPQDLHLERGFPVYVSWTTEVFIGATILVVALGLLFFIKGLGKKFFILAFVWAVIVHSPHSGIVIPMNSFFLEHWMYLLLVGPTLFLAYGLSMLPKPYLYLSAVFVPILGFLTWQQCRYWRDPITFYQRIIALEKKPFHRVLNNLGMAYSDNGDTQLAIEYYRKAIEASDAYPQTRHNLGLALLKNGEIENAKSQFLRAIELNPEFYFSLEYLSKICEFQKNMKCAQDYKDQYIQFLKRFAPWKDPSDS